MTIYLIQQSPRKDVTDLVRQRPRYKWVWASLQYIVPTVVQYATVDRSAAIEACRRLNGKYTNYVAYHTPIEML